MPNPPAPGAPRRSPYVTPEGRRRLEAELDALWRVERPRVTREVSVAAAQGDRSENAEYIYGKKRLREIDRRVHFLRKRLDELQVVVPSAEQEGRIFFGAFVTLESEEGEVVEYRIVGPDESDAATGAISIDSPMARALLRREEDDEVVVARPAGRARFTVLRIRYAACDEPSD
ncbi:MAG: transcription elongation factor GreB [Deltaproteobacteria bacterium]|nr:transcription elongation factor GreB [Deltaproteobacteria bacterium]